LVQADSPDHTVPVTRVTKASLDDFFESHGVEATVACQDRC